MNIVDLESFIAVVDSGSIVAAAARLHITQSAITRRIQNLEDVLGVPLFDRQTRPLQLTKEGRATYANAKPVLTAVEDLKSAVMHDGEPAGNFSFGIARGLGDRALTTSIAALRREFPLLKLQAYSQWTDSLINSVRSRSLEAAVVLLPAGAMPPADVECESLGKQRFVIVGPKTSGRATSITLREISSRGWVLSPEGCGIRYAVESALLHQRLPFQIAVEAEGKDLQLSLVAKGIGFGIVPQQVYDASPCREDLSVFRATDFTPYQEVWVVYSKQLGKQTKVLHELKKVLLQSQKGVKK
jgi:DNA-binding transcriptional LysR family regulator